MSDPWGTTVIGNRGAKKNPVVVRNETDLNKARRTGAAIQTDKKLMPGLNKATSGDHARIAKLDRENEVAPPAKIAPSVGRAIMEGRNAKGLNQKDLAQKVNETAKIIQDYEAGKAIPNQIVLAKLERVLEVKLRGNDIGAKLEPKGKKKDEKSAPSGSK